MRGLEVGMPQSVWGGVGKGLEGSCYHTKGQAGKILIRRKSADVLGHGQGPLGLFHRDPEEGRSPRVKNEPNVGLYL